MARPWGFPLEGIVTPRCASGMGSWTRPCRWRWRRHLARTIPTAEATIFPGEAHHLLYDRWEEILGEVARRSRERAAR